MSGKRGEQNSETVSNQINTFARTTCFASPSFASCYLGAGGCYACLRQLEYHFQLKFPLGITPVPHHPSPSIKKKKKKKVCQLTLEHRADGVKRKLKAGQWKHPPLFS